MLLIFLVRRMVLRDTPQLLTPQQNGVAERKNKTILNMMRSLLSWRNVPETFWTEAVKWVVYLLNRSPTFAVKDATPEEVWCEVKPSVKYLRIFGCLAHVHILDAQRKKFVEEYKQL